MKHYNLSKNIKILSEEEYVNRMTIEGYNLLNIGEVINLTRTGTDHVLKTINDNNIIVYNYNNDLYLSIKDVKKVFEKDISKIGKEKYNSILKRIFSKNKFKNKSTTFFASMLINYLLNFNWNIYKEKIEDISDYDVISIDDVLSVSFYPHNEFILIFNVVINFCCEKNDNKKIIEKNIKGYTIMEEDLINIKLIKDGKIIHKIKDTNLYRFE